MKYFPNQRLCFGRWQSIPGEKLEYPGDLVVYCKHYNKTCLTAFTKTNRREISLYCNWWFVRVCEFYVYIMFTRPRKDKYLGIKEQKLAVSLSCICSLQILPYNLLQVTWKVNVATMMFAYSLWRYLLLSKLAAIPIFKISFDTIFVEVYIFLWKLPFSSIG